MRREGLYSFLTWASITLALIAAILGAIALGTPWYVVEDSALSYTKYYRWQEVDAQSGAGVKKSYEYYELGLDSLYNLTQATLGLTITGFVMAFVLFIYQLAYLVGKVVSRLRLSQSFLRQAWVVGGLATILYCAAIATYSFWNNAYARSDAVSCPRGHGDICSQFVGSSGSLSWGPYVGWAVTVAATACALFSTVLFLIGSKKERIIENFETQLLMQE